MHWIFNIVDSSEFVPIWIINVKYMPLVVYLYLWIDQLVVQSRSSFG
jgi:hypothetical protein